MIAGANHMSMCRFKNRKDDGYEKFQDVLGQYVDAIENNTESGAKEVLIKDWIDILAAAADPNHVPEGRSDVVRTSPLATHNMPSPPDHHLANSCGYETPADDDINAVSSDNVQTQRAAEPGARIRAPAKEVPLRATEIGLTHFADNSDSNSNEYEISAAIIVLIADQN
jgi:hypothetical protein